MAKTSFKKTTTTEGGVRTTTTTVYSGGKAIGSTTTTAKATTEGGVTSYKPKAEPRVEIIGKEGEITKTYYPERGVGIEKTRRVYPSEISALQKSKTEPSVKIIDEATGKVKETYYPERGIKITEPTTRGEPRVEIIDERTGEVTKTYYPTREQLQQEQREHTFYEKTIQEPISKIDTSLESFGISPNVHISLIGSVLGTQLPFQFLPQDKTKQIKSYPADIKIQTPVTASHIVDVGTWLYPPTAKIKGTAFITSMGIEAVESGQRGETLISGKGYAGSSWLDIAFAGLITAPSIKSITGKVKDIPKTYITKEKPQKTQAIIEEVKPQTYIEIAQKGEARGVAESKYFEIKDVKYFEEPSKASFQLRLKEPELKTTFVKEIQVPKEQASLYKDILLPSKPAEARFLLIKQAEIDVAKYGLTGTTKEYLFIRKGLEGKGGLLDEGAFGFKRTRLMKGKKVVKESFETIEPSRDLLGSKTFKQDIKVDIHRRQEIGKLELVSSKETFERGSYEVVELGLLSKEIKSGKIYDDKAIALIKRYDDIGIVKKVERESITLGEAFKDIEKGKYTTQYQRDIKDSGFGEGKWREGTKSYGDMLKDLRKDKDPFKFTEKARTEKLSQYQKTPEYQKGLVDIKPTSGTVISFGEIEALSKGVGIDYSYSKGFISITGRTTETMKGETIEFSKADSLMKPELKIGLEIKQQAEMKLQPELRQQPELKLMPELKLEPKSQLKPELKLEAEMKLQQEQKLKLNLKLGVEVEAPITKHFPLGFTLFDNKKEIKKQKKTKEIKQQFHYAPNIAGLVFDEGLIKEPKGKKVFFGTERRAGTLKPLSISPFKTPSVSFKTPKRSLTKMNFKSPFDIKKKKGKKRRK